MKYTITYNDGYIKQSFDFSAPERLPQPGDVYEFTKLTSTLGNLSYFPGDKLEIIERTNDTPHHRLSSLGNLRVKSVYNTSVWTSIEDCISDGTLKLI